MTDILDKEISKKLKESGELEGGLFVTITLTYWGRRYEARRELYAVKNGIV